MRQRSIALRPRLYSRGVSLSYYRLLVFALHAKPLKEEDLILSMCVCDATAGSGMIDGGYDGSHNLTKLLPDTP